MSIQYVNSALIFFISISLLGIFLAFGGGLFIDALTIGDSADAIADATPNSSFSGDTSEYGFINMYYYLCFPGCQILGLLVYAQSIYKQTSGEQRVY